MPWVDFVQLLPVPSDSSNRWLDTCRVHLEAAEKQIDGPFHSIACGFLGPNAGPMQPQMQVKRPDALTTVSPHSHCVCGSFSAKKTHLACRMKLEDRSRSTRENALLSLQISASERQAPPCAALISSGLPCAACIAIVHPRGVLIYAVLTDWRTLPIPSLS